MSDWTDFEYKKVLGVYEDDERFGPILVSGPPSKVDKMKLTQEDYNFTVDWRQITNAPPKKVGQKKNKNKGVSVITPVKDQTSRRTCSSSYAFATIAALESLFIMQNPGQRQIELSE